jgi:hypothetical protein
MEPCKTGVMSAMMSGSESAGDVSCGSKNSPDDRETGLPKYPQQADILSARSHVSKVPSTDVLDYSIT